MAHIHNGMAQLCHLCRCTAARLYIRYTKSPATIAVNRCKFFFYIYDLLRPQKMIEFFRRFLRCHHGQLKYFYLHFLFFSLCGMRTAFPSLRPSALPFQFSFRSSLFYFSCFLRERLLLGKNQAKAYVVVPDDGGVPVTVRHTAAPGKVVPTTTTEHTATTGCGSNRVVRSCR